MKRHQTWRRNCVAVLSGILIQAPAAAGAKNTLVFSMEAEIPALDQHKANALPSFTVGNALFECLVRRAGGKILPGVAQKWETSPDGRTLTFHLRSSKWSDGKPVTAQDFEFGFKRLLNPRTAAEYAFAAYYITGAEAYNLGRNPDPESVGVKALDTKTLRIQLVNPTPYFLGYLGFYCFAPARRDIIEKYGDAYATSPGTAVYNGPFILEEWDHDLNKLLVKNPDYWNPSAIKLDAVQILQVADTSTALAMFEGGDLDFVEVPPDLYKHYEQRGLAKPFYNGADDWIKVNLRPDPKKPWLANANFRRALAWAIDRQAYCQLSTQGLYTPSLRYVLPIVQGVSDKYGSEYPLQFYGPRGDPAKARAFLKEAMGELRISSPAKITIEYLIQDNEETQLMARTLQQQIQRALGITVALKFVTRKQRAEMEQAHQYDLVYNGWMPDYDDPMSYMEIWLGDSSQNNSGYASREYDALIKAALQETDPKRRMDTIAKAERILLNDAPMIPLHLRRKAILTNPALKNLSTPLIGAQYDFVYASLK